MTADAQSAIHSSEPLDLRSLIETIPAMVVCALPDGSVELANRAWQEYIGGSLQQLRLSGWQTAIHPDDVAGVVEDWNSTLPTGKPFATEARIRRADGQYRWFVVRKALAIPPNQGSNWSLRTLIACEDIDERKQAEARLLQSEQRWQTAFENSAIAIMIRDRADRVLAANRAFRNMLGYTESELHQLRQIDATYEEDRELNLELIGELWEGKRQQFQIEKRYRRKDGTLVWVRNNVSFVPGTGAVAPFLFTIVEDITQRKQEESERRYIEQRYRVMVETASDAVICMDENGAILLANPATTRIFGYETAELIGKPLTVLMPEFLRKLHDDGFRRYLTTRQRHINWQGTEFTGLRKDRQEFPVEISFGEVTADGHKVFTGFIRDISARKHAEEQLRASERTLRELTETIPQMLWSADADGAVDYCNQRVLDYTGLSAEQVRGAGWRKSVHQDDIEKMVQAWMAAVSTGEPFQYEFRCLHAADRAYRWCISSAVPLRDQEGRVLKWFGTVVDLHDWKEAQHALQMSQAELARVSRLTTMGELAASIAHEVNQPLTAVTNNGSACLRLLAKRNLDPEVLRRALEEIVADGTRASAVIGRIRAFIKKAPTEKNKVDLNDVIREVLALAGRELYENRVRLEFRLTPALPLVLADRVQLQQVLLNLIMNGVEAMTTVDDQPRLLRVESRTDESGDVMVAVQDSGTGLGVEADLVFTPFFTTKAHGMGMGLSISRSLIEGHGGRLWATPNSPHGAIFSFTLPVPSRSSS